MSGGGVIVSSWPAGLCKSGRARRLVGDEAGGVDVGAGASGGMDGGAEVAAPGDAGAAGLAAGGAAGLAAGAPKPGRNGGVLQVRCVSALSVFGAGRRLCVEDWGEPLGTARGSRLGRVRSAGTLLGGVPEGTVLPGGMMLPGGAVGGTMPFGGMLVSVEGNVEPGGVPGVTGCQGVGCP